MSGLASRLSPNDNIATLLDPAEADSPVKIVEARSGEVDAESITATTDILFGHKIALTDIAPGEDILKYGFPIGRALTAISQGDHVHVHNVISKFSPKPDSTHAPHRKIISSAKLREVTTASLLASGAPSPVAENVADHILEAHLRGAETHGLRRLKPYISRIKAGAVDASSEPEITRSNALLSVDGLNGVGHHVASVTADQVAACAKDMGCAVGVIRNSNHFGFAGYYATRMAAKGTVALVASNGQVCIGPDGALRALLSNNPLAIAAPLPDGTFFEFDMATSVTSRANILSAAKRGDAIPGGIALGSDGHPTTDAEAALNGVLLPIGGNRGFGLIAAIEVLTGVLTGGAYADLVTSKETNPEKPEGTAHFMFAIDIERALGQENFATRLTDFVNRISDLPMREGVESARHPGKRRWALRKERLAIGIPLTASDYEELCSLASDLDLTIED